MIENLYFYRATINSVWDGDTVTATVDCGFHIKKEKVKIRLYGINAPELKKETLEQGRASRDFLRSLVLGNEIIIETVKDKKGKYGRYLANLWIDIDGYATCVNDHLVENNYAVYKEY